MKTFLLKFRILAIVFILANLFFANTAFSQTVTTDLLDYPPGATAIITGSGFQANEYVTLQVVHIGIDPNGIDGGNHQPFTIQADSSGNISSVWIVPTGADSLGATFLLTADGQSSLSHAEWTFTDAISITPFTIGTQTGTLTAGTAGSVTYSGSINSSGNPNTISVTIGVTGLPAGVTYTPATVSVPKNATVAYTLIFTTTAATPSGSFPFTVTGSGSGITSASATGNLAVGIQANIYESYAIMNFGGSDVYYDLSAVTTIISTQINSVKISTRSHCA